MTIAITRAQIPDSAFTNGLESLAIWALSTLEFMANGERYQEAEGLNVERVQQSLFRSYSKETIISYRVNVPLAPDYATGGYPTLWDATSPHFSGTIPAEFLQGA